ncbi:MAG: proline--tRNA ligase, partial [Phycisphaerales bacterium]|nr:proline--tRNA ligase [Phycisphaerales bacterium]
LMKDAYSFHDSVESLDEGYQKMYDAYCRIFARCGLPYAPVEAESGPIGGDASHEFMVLTDAGEDFVALTENKDYAANTERAVCAPLPQDNAEMAAIEEVHTPNQRTIDEVSAFLKTTPSKMIKTLVYLGTPPSAGKKGAPAEPAIFVALVRGDHDANENKLNRAAGKVWTAANGGDGASISLELADEGTIRRLTGADVGFAGPHTLDASGIPYHLIVDQGVAVMRNGATGANKTDYHAVNVNPGRDFPIEGQRVVVADIRNVVDGDLSPKGGGSPIRLRKAIEVGHVFKLGTKYSDSMGATYLDKNGKAKPLIMGCYGIGLNRIMASAIEANHDDGGVIWPMSIAPFQALVVALDPREEEVMQTAGRIHDALEAAGVDTLLDDRDERAGFKFKDADLIGFPVRVTVGRKALADGVVEVKLRSSDEIEKLAPDAAIDRVKSLVADAMNALNNG